MAEQNRRQAGFGTTSGEYSSDEDQPAVGTASAVMGNTGRLLDLLEPHDPCQLLAPIHAAYRP